MRQSIGAILVLLGVITVESDWIWIPAAFIGCGAVLALKKAPSSRQAKEGAHKKTYINTISRKGRIAKDENRKSNSKQYCVCN